MFNYVRDVAIGGVLALYDLKLYAPSEGRVLLEFAIGSGCVADGSKDVWFVVGGSLVCW